MTESRQSLSDGEESELGFSDDSNSTRHTSRATSRLSDKHHTTSPFFVDHRKQYPPVKNISGSLFPPIENAKSSYAGTQRKNSNESGSQKGLFDRIRSKIVKSRNRNSVGQNAVSRCDLSERSGSTGSMASTVSRSSKGQDPKDYNEALAGYRCSVIDSMQEETEVKATHEYNEKEKEKQERAKEELEKERKIQLIKQEQAIRGQLPGSEHLRQRYTIMYHMNKERRNDAVYISTMLEMMLSKPGFNASFSKFLAQADKKKEEKEPGSDVTKEGTS